MDSTSAGSDKYSPLPANHHTTASHDVVVVSVVPILLHNHHSQVSVGNVYLVTDAGVQIAEGLRWFQDVMFFSRWLPMGQKELDSFCTKK